MNLPNVACLLDSGGIGVGGGRGACYLTWRNRDERPSLIGPDSCYWAGGCSPLEGEPDSSLGPPRSWRGEWPFFSLPASSRSSWWCLFWDSATTSSVLRTSPQNMGRTIWIQYPLPGMESQGWPVSELRLGPTVASGSQRSLSRTSLSFQKRVLGRTWPFSNPPTPQAHSLVSFGPQVPPVARGKHARHRLSAGHLCRVVFVQHWSFPGLVCGQLPCNSGKRHTKGRISSSCWKSFST